MTEESMRELTAWMTKHEQDIYRERNDYGDLKKVFKDVVGRDAGIPAKDVDSRNARIEQAASPVALPDDPLFPHEG